jgi:hypothetical protein
MAKRGPIGLLAGILALTLILAGCGGGSSDTSSSGDLSASPLSKAEFIKKADAICAAGGKRTQAEFASYVKEKKISAEAGPTAAQFAEISENIQVPAYKRQAEELRALGAPSGEEEKVTAIFDAIDAGIEKVEEADPKEALESSNSMFVEADTLAVEYGFKVCGHSEGKG